MLKVETVQQSRSFGAIFSQHRSPRAIAAGASFGLMLGMIPKDNLLALLILVAILVLPVHQLLGCVVAITTSLTSVLCSSWVSELGVGLLSIPLVGQVISVLYQWPLMPWLKLENSQVAGGAVAGAVLWLPNYLFSAWFAAKTAQNQYGAELIQLAATSLKRKRSKVSDSIEAASPSSPLIVPNEATSPNAYSDVDTLEVVDALLTPIQEITWEVSQLATSATERKSSPARYESTHIKIQENHDSPLELEPERQESLELPSVHPGSLQAEALVEEERVLRETVIEIIRYKRPNTESKEGDLHSPLHQDLTCSEETSENMNLVTSLVAKSKMPSTVDASMPGIAASPLPTANSIAAESATYRSANGARFINHPGSKDEALRHILKHIHGTRDSRKEPEKSA